MMKQRNQVTTLGALLMTIDELAFAEVRTAVLEIHHVSIQYEDISLRIQLGIVRDIEHILSVHSRSVILVIP